MMTSPAQLRKILIGFAVVSTVAGVYFLIGGSRLQYGVLLLAFAALEIWMVMMLGNRKPSP